MDPRLREVLSHIGANVRRYRQKRGLTQERLAEIAGIELRGLQRIEVGETNMTIETLLSVADALEVAPGFLFRPAEMPEIKRGRPPKKRPAE